MLRIGISFMIATTLGFIIAVTDAHRHFLAWLWPIITGAVEWIFL